MKVLIVDDERLICEWLEYCIQSEEEYEIVGIAKNGVEALKIFNEKKPDIVLTDIKMPNMDGLELLKEIKKINHPSYVVILTAHSEFDYARVAVREGADDYLLKTELNKEMVLDLLHKFSLKRIREPNKSIVSKHPLLKQILTSRNPLSKEQVNVLKENNFSTMFGNYYAISLLKTDLYALNLENNYNDNIKVLYELDTNKVIITIVISINQAVTELSRQALLKEYIDSISSEYVFSIGISNCSQRLDRLNILIEESMYALSKTFYDNTIRASYAPKDQVIEEISESVVDNGIFFNSLLHNIIVSSGTIKQNSIIEFYDAVKTLEYENLELVFTLANDIINNIFGNNTNPNLDHNKAELERRKKIIKECKYIDN